ncbi:MAG: hypothetical protein U5M53_13540 [Rhodoferax sp.]|nr:hypothetical protein [Rhodoferax sp.]
MLAYVAGVAGTAATTLTLPLQAQSAMTPALSPIQTAALAEVLRFYAPFRSTPDVSKLRVTVEDFAWNGAVYRVDVVVDEYPVFLPWNSDYAMAHRLWLAADGSPVKSETIYTRPNLETTSASAALPLERRGFYPGSRAFSVPLRFVEQALVNAGTISFARAPSPAEFRVEHGFHQGLPDVAEHMGEISERTDRYLLSMSAVPLSQRSPRDVNTMTLEIDKATGAVSNARFHLNMPPALM